MRCLSPSDLSFDLPTELSFDDLPPGPVQDSKFEIGIMKSIRFQNEKGFIIATFENQHKGGLLRQFAGLGNMHSPETGLAYKLYGRWETGKFGPQYKFDHYELMQPSSTKGIYQYLIRMCKHVGPTVAGRIVDKYKEQSLDILKTDPNRVAVDIKGMTLERAKQAMEDLLAHDREEKTVVELEAIFSSIPGVKKSLPVELSKIWGANAVPKLKENPYILTLIHGVGFPSADMVALKMGFDSKSKKRCKAAIHHVLKEMMALEGSIWMAEQDLVSRVTGLTGVYINDAVLEMCASEILTMKESEVALSFAAESETYIAEKIIRMVVWEDENKNEK